MQHIDTFSGYHPTINFLYFALVLVGAMALRHPACLAISLLCAAIYCVRLTRRGAARLFLRFLLPLMLLTALVNPAFSHEGATILWYFPSGNPLTLESILYGLAMSVMLAAVLCWFSCYNAVMTSDKFVYLFGRVIPALSLLLSMALRFVPRLKAQARVISDAQASLGRTGGGLRERTRRGLTQFSILVTWSLESAIETADSMKSRGYGLPGRTAFSLYRFDRRDRAALLFLLICGVYIAVGAALGALKWRFYPTVKGAALGPYALSVFAVYFALCIAPVIIDEREDRKWKRLQSAI